MRPLGAFSGEQGTPIKSKCGTKSVLGDILSCLDWPCRVRDCRMTEDKTRTQKLEEMLDDPQSVSSDAGSVTNRSISDAIALDKHMAKKEAASSRRLGIRIGKFVGPSHY